MRPEHEKYFIVPNMDVGVVPFMFGNSGDFVRKIHRGIEVLELKLAPDLVDAFFVDVRPSAAEFLKKRLYPLLIERGGASFTGNTFFGREIFHRVFVKTEYFLSTSVSTLAYLNLSLNIFLASLRRPLLCMLRKILVRMDDMALLLVINLFDVR